MGKSWQAGAAFDIDAPAMRVDLGAHADLSLRLSEIARRVDAVRDELSAVRAVVEQAMGQGRPAEAFRLGADAMACSCARGVEEVSRALTAIADNVDAAAALSDETDGALGSRSRGLGGFHAADVGET